MESLVQQCLTIGLSWYVQGVVFLVGYAFSVIGGNLAAREVIEKIARDSNGTRNREVSTRLLGIIEGVVYTTAWVIGKELIIPVWLGLKASEYWGKLSLPQVRPIFNRWLIGTGLSLRYGVAGGVMITKATTCELGPAVLPAALLAIATVILGWYAGWLTREQG